MRLDREKKNELYDIVESIYESKIGSSSWGKWEKGEKARAVQGFTMICEHFQARNESDYDLMKLIFTRYTRAAAQRWFKWSGACRTNYLGYLYTSQKAEARMKVYLARLMDDDDKNPATTTVAGVKQKQKWAF